MLLRLVEKVLHHVAIAFPCSIVSHVDGLVALNQMELKLALKRLLMSTSLYDHREHDSSRAAE